MSKLFISSCLLYFLSFCLALSVFSKPLARNLSHETSAPETIVFSNFNKPVILLKAEKEANNKLTLDQLKYSPGEKRKQLFHVVDSNMSVVLSNSLIVKTNKSLKPAKINRLHSAIHQVTPIFAGKLFDFYLVELEEFRFMQAALNFLAKIKGIELVQPDILQLRRNYAQSVKVPASGLSKGYSLDNYLTRINIASLWQHSKGEGVKIAIIDDGFNLNHPELQHIQPHFSYDLESQTLTSNPRYQQDNHGTKVAGIIFAAHDGKGIEGIAPEAKLIALRHSDTWTSKTVLSFQLAQLASADVINCSWISRWLLQPVADVVNEMAVHGRNGKGTAVVFAAGNQGKEITPNSTEAAISGALVVSAHNDKGLRIATSNYGQFSDLLIYGQKAKTSSKSGGWDNFSGTSLAAAVTSGLAALLLSQFPQLTLQELKNHLLLLSRRNYL